LNKAPYEPSTNELKELIRVSEEKVVELEQGYKDIFLKHRKLEERNMNLFNSFSWRITRPLRFIRELYEFITKKKKGNLLRRFLKRINNLT
jgi:acyl-[acyl carrier protein]--UDP-N-acetylglucosamine O-acyltransferase